MKKFIHHLIFFLFVYTGHFLVVCINFYNSFGKNGSLSPHDYWFTYKNHLLHHQGIAIALLATFALWIIIRLYKSREFKTVRSGLIVFTVLFIGGYLALGINNSTPMFTYLNDRLGYFFTKMQYTLLLLVSIISTTAGFLTTIISSRRQKKKL